MMDKQVRITQALSWENRYMLNLIKAMEREELGVDDIKLLTEDTQLVTLMAVTVANNLLKPYLDIRDFMELKPDYQLFVGRREVNAAEIRRSMRFFGYEPATPADVPGAYRVWHPTKQPISFFVLEGTRFVHFDRDHKSKFNYDQIKYVSASVFWLNFFLGKKLIDELA